MRILFKDRIINYTTWSKVITDLIYDYSQLREDSNEDFKSWVAREWNIRLIYDAIDGRSILGFDTDEATYSMLLLRSI